MQLTQLHTGCMPSAVTAHVTAHLNIRLEINQFPSNDMQISVLTYWNILLHIYTSKYKLWTYPIVYYKKKQLTYYTHTLNSRHLGMYMTLELELTLNKSSHIVTVNLSHNNV